MLHGADISKENRILQMEKNAVTKSEPFCHLLALSLLKNTMKVQIAFNKTFSQYKSIHKVFISYRWFTCIVFGHCKVLIIAPFDHDFHKKYNYVSILAVWCSKFKNQSLSWFLISGRSVGVGCGLLWWNFSIISCFLLSFWESRCLVYPTSNYTLSHPENDRDVTDCVQEYTLQDASFMRQSLSFWTCEKTHKLRARWQVSSSGIRADVTVVLEVRQSIDCMAQWNVLCPRCSKSSSIFIVNTIDIGEPSDAISWYDLASSSFNLNC